MRSINLAANEHPDIEQPISIIKLYNSESMTLEIKKATTDEADQLANILAQAAQLKVALGDDAWATRDFTLELLREWIGEDDTYTVRRDGSIVATFALTWEDAVWGEQLPIAGYIHKLAVSDSARGNGIGEKILDWASAYVAENSREFLRLDFPRQNQGLKNYYEKQGFVWVRDTKVQRPGKVYLVHLYERPAAPRPRP